MNEKMTIYFNRRTGAVKEMCGGEQGYDWFGDEAEDFKQIFDFIVVDYDAYVVNNFFNFEVRDSELKLLRNNIPDKYL